MNRIVLAAILAAFSACNALPNPSLGDGGSTDAGKESDGGSDGGTSLGLCSAGFASCATYTDATASGASRIISVDCISGCVYTPKCLQVKVGQEVTWTMDFTAHPLKAACGPDGVSASAGSSVKTTYNTAGDRGFHCNIHGSAAGAGMAGSIRVVP